MPVRPRVPAVDDGAHHPGAARLPTDRSRIAFHPDNRRETPLGETDVANHKDALKRNRQNIKRRLRNRHYRTMMRNRIKKLRTLVDAGDKAAAEAALPDTVSMIHRVAQKGIIHKRQAARRVSRLSHAVNGMG